MRLVDPERRGAAAGERDPRVVCHRDGGLWAGREHAAHGVVAELGPLRSVEAVPRRRQPPVVAREKEPEAALSGAGRWLLSEQDLSQRQGSQAGKELAALYHERWEIETALDELKTHLRGARIVLRSKKPELVEQEFYGLLLAHFALRGLMHEAALKAHVDPDTLSFVHSLRVVRRKLPRSGENCLSRDGLGGDLGRAGVLQPRALQPKSQLSGPQSEQYWG